MLKQLKVVLDIQEYDMKMIRLMRLKRERLQELDHINALRHELHKQQKDKEIEISELNRSVANQEMKISENQGKTQKARSTSKFCKKSGRIQRHHPRDDASRKRANRD